MKYFLLGLLITFVPSCFGADLPDKYHLKIGTVSVSLNQTQNTLLRSIVLINQGQVISDGVYFTEGFIKNGYLSPSGKYIAVNIRVSDGGDYVWIFSTSTSYAFKQPDLNVISEILESLGMRYSEYVNDLADHYTFACGWESPDDISVCNILLSRKDQTGILACFDTYQVGKYGGCSITQRKIRRVDASDFKSLPSSTADFWKGWESRSWSTKATKPLGSNIQTGN